MYVSIIKNDCICIEKQHFKNNPTKIRVRIKQMNAFNVLIK